MTASVVRLQREQTQLLVVDIQEKLLPFIDRHESVVAQSAKLLRAADVLGVPVIVSEQYPQGLGPTHAAIREATPAGAAHCTKMTFSCCADEGGRAALQRTQRRQVLLIGIETHVCVLQTALDLAAEGAVPVVLADAVGSRRDLDHRVALERMRSAGVVVSTVESVIFELVHASGTDLFKRILPIVK